MSKRKANGKELNVMPENDGIQISGIYGEDVTGDLLLHCNTSDLKSVIDAIEKWNSLVRIYTSEDNITIIDGFTPPILAFLTKRFSEVTRSVHVKHENKKYLVHHDDYEKIGSVS